MKKLILRKLLIMLLAILAIPLSGNAQFERLIPNNTATHIAIKSGQWTNPSTWNKGSVPNESSIVIIPENIEINYNTNSNQHIFAIRNDGIMTFWAPNGAKRKLIVDTFVNSTSSFLNINASQETSGTIEIILKAFDIEKKKRGGIGGSFWNQNAKSHYKDGLRVNDHFGKRFPDDGPGVLGRHSWDPEQVSITLMTRGKVRIKGIDKTDFLSCSGNVSKGQKKINLDSNPSGWKVGDQIMITGTERRQKSEVFTIKSINGSMVTIDSDKGFIYDHKGISSRDLYTHTANMTRNVIIRSFYTDKSANITRRGHSMFMFNGDIRIENTAFIDLGRTDKGNIIDDFKYNIKVSGDLKNARIENLNYNAIVPPQNIENQRGRYAFHFHKSLKGINSNKLIIARGNVVWGSPGWGMVHHDSHADFTDNIVYEISGGGMIAESGSETGIWKHNLVASMDKVKRPYFVNSSYIPGPLRLQSRDILDDDFRGGAAFGLQSRAVRMVNNVGTGAGVVYHYQASGEQSPTADRLSTSALAKEVGFDAFPLESTIERSAPALVEFRGNIAYNCGDSFKSQQRAEHAYHRVQSVIKNMKAWNTTRFAIYINNNFGYTFQDSYFHTKTDSETIGALIQASDDNLNWSNTTFEGFKFKPISIVNGNNTNSNNHENSEFVFHNVTWRNSKARPYSAIFKGTANVISGTLQNKPVTFKRKRNMDATINVSTNDFKVSIEGIITDNAGESTFAHYSPNNSKANIRRVYDFKNKATLDKYLDVYGKKRDAKGDYTILTEYISDRVTGKVTPIKFRIDLKGLSSSRSILNKDVDALSFLQVTPNPIEGSVLRFSQRGNKYIQIINLSGIIIKEVPVSEEENSVDISGIPKGIYILKSDKNSTKFVVQ